MTEHDRQFSDVSKRRVILNMYDAGKLNAVTVKLEVDFEAILKL